MALRTAHLPDALLLIVPPQPEEPVRDSLLEEVAKGVLIGRPRSEDHANEVLDDDDDDGCLREEKKPPEVVCPP